MWEGRSRNRKRPSRNQRRLSRNRERHFRAGSRSEDCSGASWFRDSRSASSTATVSKRAVALEEPSFALAIARDALATAEARVAIDGDAFVIPDALSRAEKAPFRIGERPSRARRSPLQSPESRVVLPRGALTKPRARVAMHRSKTSKHRSKPAPEERGDRFPVRRFRRKRSGRSSGRHVRDSHSASRKRKRAFPEKDGPNPNGYCDLRGPAPASLSVIAMPRPLFPTWQSEADAPHSIGSPSSSSSRRRSGSSSRRKNSSSCGGLTGVPASIA
jgi:hypothetical protein